MGRKPELLPEVHPRKEPPDPREADSVRTAINVTDNGLNGMALARTAESKDAWLLTDDWYPVDMME